MTILKFTVETTYALPSNIGIVINEVELTLSDLELAVDFDFRFKITKVRFRPNKRQGKLVIYFENEAVVSEPPDVVPEKINSIRGRLLEIFREVAEGFAILLQLRHGFPPLIPMDVKVSHIQIDYGKHKYLILEETLHITETVGLAIKKSFKPSDLSDTVKKSVHLAKLDHRSKEMVNLLKRIIKWYFHALNEPNDADRFVHYLMIFEIWRLYKAYKDNDKECIPYGKYKPPHRKCLSKAIKNLCQDVFNKLGIGFSEFYDGRNNVIHEGLWEEASRYVGVASECARKIIEEIQNEVRNFLS